MFFMNIYYYFNFMNNVTNLNLNDYDRSLNKYKINTINYYK